MVSTTFKLLIPLCAIHIFFVSRTSADFSVYISSDEATTNYVLALTNTLTDARDLGCINIPIERFDLNSAHGRYVKLVIDTYIGASPGLQYVTIDHKGISVILFPSVLKYTIKYPDTFCLVLHTLPSFAVTVVCHVTLRLGR